MTQVTTLAAETREHAGKGKVRAVRRLGRVPGVIYGDKQPPLTISIEDNLLARQLERPGFLTQLFDIDISGDYVRNALLNNGTNLFKISGPGSLQGTDAAEALVAAFSDPNNGDDTYTEIPFQVTDAGNPTPRATSATTIPAQYGLLGDLEKALRSIF